MSTFKFNYMQNNLSRQIAIFAWLLAIPILFERTALFLVMWFVGMAISFAVLIYLHAKSKRTGTGVLHDEPAIFIQQGPYAKPREFCQLEQFILELKKRV